MTVTAATPNSKYFIVKIVLVNKEVVTFKNLTEDQWNHFRETIFYTGFKKPHSKYVIEQVSPYFITQVFGIEQMGHNGEPIDISALPANAK